MPSLLRRRGDGVTPATVTRPDGRHGLDPSQDEALKVWHEFRHGVGKTLKSFVISSHTRLAYLSTPDVLRLLAAGDGRDEIHLERLGQVEDEWGDALRPRVIFVVSSDFNDNLNALLSIVMWQAIYLPMSTADTRNSGKLPRPVSLVFDEFKNIGKIGSFVQTIAVVRSRNIDVAIMLQNASQLEEVYGKEGAATIRGNCATTVYLGGGRDFATAKQISEETGKETVYKYDWSRQGSGIGATSTRQRNTLARDVYDPNEVSTLPATKALVLIADAKRRNEEDLATARAIQESALPRTFPPFPEVQEFDIFASMSAAKEVGGDFYDFFLIDDHTLGFLIADVSGKGIPGALFMMAAKAELENFLSTGMEPAEAIAATNRALCANNDAGMFVTVWAATLDWQTGVVTYVNAGHNFPLLRRGRGGDWKWLKKRCGLFLGTFETAKYRQETLQLQPGDELVLYTDGVNEAFDVQEREYGNDRLEEFLCAHADLHPRRLARALRGSVFEWARGAEQSDDVTILVLEYGVAPEKTESLESPATLDHLAAATALVTEELERMECPSVVRHEIVIALEELFVNVCNYAYAHDDTPGRVLVRYSSSRNPSSMSVELQDSGVPFNPLHRADPPRPTSIKETRIGGLGIHMVKRTMDEFTYTRNGTTNIVTFGKSW